MDYFGIKDIKNIFANIDDSEYYKPKLVKSSFNNSDEYYEIRGDDSEYYKPKLVKSSFNNSDEYYEIRGDRNKNLSINQYLYMIILYLTELINE